jgi:hypothetical protein
MPDTGGVVAVQPQEVLLTLHPLPLLLKRHHVNLTSKQRSDAGLLDDQHIPHKLRNGLASIHVNDLVHAEQVFILEEERRVVELAHEDKLRAGCASPMGEVLPLAGGPHVAIGDVGVVLVVDVPEDAQLLLVEVDELLGVVDLLPQLEHARPAQRQHCQQANQFKH